MILCILCICFYSHPTVKKQRVKDYNIIIFMIVSYLELVELYKFKESNNGLFFSGNIIL